MNGNQKKNERLKFEKDYTTDGQRDGRTQEKRLNKETLPFLPHLLYFRNIFALGNNETISNVNLIITDKERISNLNLDDDQMQQWPNDVGPRLR